jgi:hypothetical protein
MSQPSSSVLGVTMLRILAPPLALGAALAASMMVRANQWEQPLAILLIVGALAVLANVIHLSVQIVSRPSEPPLGLPRPLSGFLLFVGLTILQIVLLTTATFGGCACLAKLGLRPPGLF